MVNIVEVVKFVIIVKIAIFSTMCQCGLLGRIDSNEMRPDYEYNHDQEGNSHKQSVGIGDGNSANGHSSQYGSLVEVKEEC